MTHWSFSCQQLQFNQVLSRKYSGYLSWVHFKTFWFLKIKFILLIIAAPMNITYLVIFTLLVLDILQLIIWMCNVVVMFCRCRCKNIRLDGKRHREIYKPSSMQQKRLVILNYFDTSFWGLAIWINSVLTVSSISSTMCAVHVLLQFWLKFQDLC